MSRLNHLMLPVHNGFLRFMSGATPTNLLTAIITARNEVGARLCFYTCLWFCSQGGSASVHAGIPPLARRPPWQGRPPMARQTPPPAGRLPLARQTPPTGRPPSTVHAGRYGERWNAILVNTFSIHLLFEVLVGPAPLAITSNDHLFGCLIIYMYTNSQCYFVHRYFNNARHNKVHSLMTTPCLTTTVTNDNASQIRILFSLLFAAAANYHNYARKCSKLLWWKLSYSLYPLRTAQHPTYHPTELPFNHPPPTHPLPNHPLPDLLILLPNHPPPTHLLATVPRPGIRKAIYSHLMSKQTPGQSRDPLRPVAALVSILTPTSTWWPESWRSGCCSAEVDWAPPRPRFTAKTDPSTPLREDHHLIQHPDSGTHKILQVPLKIPHLRLGFHSRVFGGSLWRCLPAQTAIIWSLCR